MSDRQSRLPDDFSGEVRLFPLPDLVMFPSNVQPLHIFESRYCEMFEHALRGDHLIAMATLEPGFDHEYYSRPAVASTVCIGRIATHDRTEDGKFNFLLVGLERARVQTELPPRLSFRQASVEVLRDRNPSADDERVLGNELATRLRQLAPEAGKLANDFVAKKIDLSALTDIIAFQIPFTCELKLRLLAETDTRERAMTLLEHFPKPVQQPPNDFPDFSMN